MDHELKAETKAPVTGDRTNEQAAGEMLREVAPGHATAPGGIFFKTNNAKATTDWYDKYLGIQTDASKGGVAILNWSDDKTEDGGHTAWKPAENVTKWFSPGTSDFMINFRVDDMKAIYERLNDNHQTIVGDPVCAENGKFLWTLDPDNRKVELWEAHKWDDKNVLEPEECRRVVGVRDTVPTDIVPADKVPKG